MDRQEIENKLKEIVADKLKIDITKITPESSLRDDLGMDSFGSIEIIFEIEDAFNINVPQEEVPNINNFRDVVDYVEKNAGTKPKENV